MTAVEELLQWVRETLPMDLDWPMLIEEKIESMIKKEKEQKIKLCYGVWRAAKSGANYIYITKDSGLLGYVEPLSEEDRLKIDVELFIKLE